MGILMIFSRRPQLDLLIDTTFDPYEFSMDNPFQISGPLGFKCPLCLKRPVLAHFIFM
jgi:hypothetical protein